MAQCCVVKHIKALNAGHTDYLSEQHMIILQKRGIYA
jgi:hypothetical protein